jgi:hypothetical protein
MTAAAGICFMLSLAFGVASVVNYFCIEGAEIDKRSDTAVLTVLFAGLSIGSFALTIWFILAATARAVLL